MRKIKVAQVITRLDWGGSPDILRIICSYLDPDIYDVTLVTGRSRHPSAKTKEFLDKFGLKAVVIPELKREINPLSDLAALIRLYWLFRLRNFDIVHTHTAKAGALGRIASSLAGKPILIHTLHGHNFYGYFNPIFSKFIVAIEKWIAGFTDKIIVTTELEKKDLLQFKVTDTGKIHLIRHGLELDRYAQEIIDKDGLRKKFNIKPDEKVIGMVGRLEPVKGPEYFIKSAVKVAQSFPKAKFIVVGEGSLRQKLEKMAKSKGLKDKFIFTGWSEDAFKIIPLFDVLVFPSLNEAVGITLIEAQLLGVPVVATAVGGIPEVIKDGQTGILVPPADSDSLSRAIKQLLADEQQRLALAYAAKVWVRDKFKAQDMVKAISVLYQELCSARK